MSDQPLWKLADIVEATGGTVSGNTQDRLSGVSIDSRTISPGDVYVAIRGDRLDGHEFAAPALKAGAGLAIVSRPDDAMRSAGPLLVVDDPLKAMEAMGRAARARSAAKIIAVTGSVGKTTTKEALKLALGGCGDTHASDASYNNQWGVPLSLARMPVETEFGVFEIGMNHPGEITPLSARVRPDIAMVTAIAECHLGHFASLDGIADAKAEIFAGLAPGGCAVINRDTAYFERLAGAARDAGAQRVVGFGEHDNADVRLKKVKLHSQSSCLAAEVLGESLMLKVGVPGLHIVHNVLGVLAVCALAGADLAHAGMALARMTAPKGRGVHLTIAHPLGALTVIDESYNANPASMGAALGLLARAETGRAGRRIAVLGDMLELGQDAERLHAGLAEQTETDADLVFACGAHMKSLWNAISESSRGAYADDAEGLEEPLLQAVRAGDVVMIKGSLGSQMAPLVDAIVQKFEPVRRPA